jgi:hypothetical protein
MLPMIVDLGRDRCPVSFVPSLEPSDMRRHPRRIVSWTRQRTRLLPRRAPLFTLAFSPSDVSMKVDGSEESATTCIDVDEPRGVDLLFALEAFINRDAAPPGFQGTVAFGVDSGASDLWLEVRLGATGAETRFTEATPKDSSARLFLGAEEAKAVLFGDPLPPEPNLVQLGGQRELIAKLLERYLRRKDLLSLRVSSAKESRKRPSRSRPRRGQKTESDR